jgi:hypothetical protein
MAATPRAGIDGHRSGRQPKTYVKPGAAITVFELLMMGGVSSETCWAIKKHWNNKLYYTVASCWFFLWDLQKNALFLNVLTPLVFELLIDVRGPGNDVPLENSEFCSFLSSAVLRDGFLWESVWGSCNIKRYRVRTWRWHMIENYAYRIVIVTLRCGK